MKIIFLSLIVCMKPLGGKTSYCILICELNDVVILTSQFVLLSTSLFPFGWALMSAWGTAAVEGAEPADVEVAERWCSREGGIWWCLEWRGVPTISIEWQFSREGWVRGSSTLSAVDARSTGQSRSSNKQDTQRVFRIPHTAALGMLLAHLGLSPAQYERVVHEDGKTHVVNCL